MYFFSKNKYKLILAAVTIVLVLIMALSTVNNPDADAATDTAVGFFAPVQNLFTRVSGGIGNFFTFLTTSKNYERENEELKQKIAKLEEQIRDGESTVAENARLRDMLGLKEKNKDYNYIAADVVSSDVTNWSKTFTINKGLADGVTKHSAVISPYGLVGYVYEVGRSWAKIVTIVDATVSVGATISRINVYSLVEGDITLQSQGLCKMMYISKDSNAETGDYVITSGTGGIYPSGLYIGKIVDLTEDTSGMSQQAVIEPGVDFDNLSEVFIIAD